jgi:hypothetical protein
VVASRQHRTLPTLNGNLQLLRCCCWLLLLLSRVPARASNPIALTWPFSAVSPRAASVLSQDALPILQ